MNGRLLFLTITLHCIEWPFLWESLQCLNPILMLNTRKLNHYFFSVHQNGLTLKNGKMKWLTFQNSQKAQTRDNSVLTNQNTALWNRSGRKKPMSPKSFVDGSWPTYVIHTFLQSKLLSNLAPFHVALGVKQFKITQVSSDLKAS